MIAPVLTRRIIDPLLKMTDSWQRQLVRVEAELEKSQWESKEFLFELQRDRLRELCVEASLKCPYYTKVFQRSGLDPAKLTLDQLAELPVLDRKTIRDNYSEILNSTVDISELTDRSSGGSTGEPVHVLRTHQSFVLGKALRSRNYSWTGWRPGDRHHWFWGAYFDEPDKTVKDRILASLYNRKFVNAYDMSEGLFESYYSEALHTKPYLLESYSNILFEFGRFIDKTGKEFLDIPAIVSSAGKLFDFQRELIQKTVGRNVFDRYGCREMDGIAHECEVHNGLHIHMERFIVEIDSPDENGFGDLLITDLANHGFPLIRYRIQDRGRLSELDCPCGRGLVMLAELQGRSLDNVRTPSGGIITGVLFPQLFFRYPNVIEGQVVQHRIDDVEALIRVDTDPDKEMLEKLKTEIESYTGPEVNVRITIVDELITNPTRKHRFVISKL